MDRAETEAVLRVYHAPLAAVFRARVGGVSCSNSQYGCPAQAKIVADTGS